MIADRAEMMIPVGTKSGKWHCTLKETAAPETVLAVYTPAETKSGKQYFRRLDTNGMPSNTISLSSALPAEMQLISFKLYFLIHMAWRCHICRHQMRQMALHVERDRCPRDSFGRVHAAGGRGNRRDECFGSTARQLSDHTVHSGSSPDKYSGGFGCCASRSGPHLRWRCL